MGAYAPQKDPEVRRSGLGSSDCAPVCGVSSYGRDAHTVYLEKIGMAAPLIETEAMELGDFLEDSVARFWSRRFAAPVRRRRATIRHPAKPYLFTHVDRVVPVGKGLTDILECKVTSVHRAHEFGERDTDQVPAPFHLQADHTMMVIPSVERVHFAVLLGGTTFWHGVVQRDAELVRDIERQETDFWLNHVVPRIPPDLDGSEGATASLAARFPVDDGAILEPDGWIDEQVAHLRTVRASLKDLETAKRLYEQRIQDRMGSASLILGDGYKVSWKEAVGPISWKGVAEALRPSNEDLWGETVAANRGAGARRFLLTEKEG